MASSCRPVLKRLARSFVIKLASTCRAKNCNLSLSVTLLVCILSLLKDCVMGQASVTPLCPCDVNTKRHPQTALCQDDFVLKIHVMYNTVIKNETAWTPAGRPYLRWRMRVWEVQVVRSFKVASHVKPRRMSKWSNNLNSRYLWRPSDKITKLLRSSQNCAKKTNKHRFRHQRNLRVRLQQRYWKRLKLQGAFRGNQVWGLENSQNQNGVGQKKRDCFPRRTQLFERRSCPAGFIDQPQNGLEVGRTFLISGRWQSNRKVINRCSILLAWKKEIDFPPSLNELQRVSKQQRRLLRRGVYLNQCRYCSVKVCSENVCNFTLGASQPSSTNESFAVTTCTWNIDRDLRHCSALYSSCRLNHTNQKCQWHHFTGYTNCEANNERNRAYHASNEHSKRS